MAARKRLNQTGFDKYFNQRMEDPTFARQYESARAEIDATDVLIRSLDDARKRLGTTKAELARRADFSPEMIRRLLTDPQANPTMNTVCKLAQAIDCHLELVPNISATGQKRARVASSAKQVRLHKS